MTYAENDAAVKFLLTGGSGFVGASVIECCLVKNCLFRLAIRDGKRFDETVFDLFHIPNEINGSTNWRNAFSKVSCVIHLAALAHNKAGGADAYKDVNVNGTLHLAREAAKHGVKRFVFVSSIGVNGIATDTHPFFINSVINPHNEYARSKYEAELGLKRISEETGLEVVIVRPTLVYGFNAPGNFNLLTKLVNKIPVLPFGLINNKRDFIAVQNLADLLITCATHPKAAGHTFLASDMETVSIKQFTNAIANGLGKKLFQLPIPVSLIRLAGKLMGKTAMVEQLVGNLQVDSSNIIEVLDWTPPFTMKQAMATLRNSGKKTYDSFN
ncbi:NAD-dependent epimerase/dehydratase family protein [Aeromonas veronii]|uniref:NAD-dependent epimerase/dehydratase family protein n=1 Tax=Aeromonas veronii TaxID=654 RepID=UPI003D1D4C4A